MGGEHPSGTHFTCSIYHSSERVRNTRQGLILEAWENENCFPILKEA
jgi:hypothetical protein